MARTKKQLLTDRALALDYDVEYNKAKVYGKTVTRATLYKHVQYDDGDSSWITIRCFDLSDLNSVLTRLEEEEG